jgi:hypothetical protein
MEFNFFLAKLQRCREEREKIIREKSLVKPSSSSSTNVDPSMSLYSDQRKALIISLFRTIS